MSQDNVCNFTGRPLQDLTIDKVLSGELTADDFRTSAETLRKQADSAESGRISPTGRKSAPGR